MDHYTFALNLTDFDGMEPDPLVAVSSKESLLRTVIFPTMNEKECSIETSLLDKTQPRSPQEENIELIWRDHDASHVAVKNKGLEIILAPLQDFTSVYMVAPKIVNPRIKTHLERQRVPWLRNLKWKRLFIRRL